MTRSRLIAACSLVLAISGPLLYLWSASRYTRPQILIPIQVPTPPPAPAYASRAAPAALVRLSEALVALGISLHEPRAIEALSHAALDEYLQTALDHPEEFFSAEFEATSLRVAAAWLSKRSVAAQEAWKICLRLRWSVPRINELVEPCQRVSRYWWRKFPENEAVNAYAQILIKQPDKKLVRAQQRYLRNPFSPRALEKLALALARVGHHDAARKLTGELLQLDGQRSIRLEDELSRLKGIRYPGFDFDFEKPCLPHKSVTSGRMKSLCPAPS